MLNLEGILKEWEEDSVIPIHQLDETSRQIPSLHAKYLEYLTVTKLSLRRAESTQKVLLKDKWIRTITERWIRVNWKRRDGIPIHSMV